MPLSRTGERPPGGGEYFPVEPNRDQLRSIARLADADELRRPSVEIFPLASAREAFRAQPGAGPARQGGVGRHMSGVLARIAGSDTVSLEWDRATGETEIVEADIGDESVLAFPVASANAGEAFRHPFRFAQ